MRYLLEIKYKGTNYNGWQAQPNSITVQSVLDQAISTIFNEPIISTGCGRTDTGVHASQFFLHFDAQGSPPNGFMHRINKFLPADISVHHISQVADSFNARFDATYRAYTYHCHFHKDAFLEPYSLLIRRDLLDVELMRQCFESLVQYQDFRAFCKTGGAQTHYLCDIYHASLTEDIANNKLQFNIAANRFLRGMIRRIVGTMLAVGQAKISPQTFHHHLATQTYFDLNISVPPQGLFLSDVRYK